MEKGYCEICDKLTNYTKKETPEKVEIHGKFYSYQKLIAYCSHCNHEVTVPSLQDENLHRIDDSYRTTENIIKLEEINQILDKYNIGKKPLSKLLGWGEITLIRYTNGDIPTKIYSNELYKILNDPIYMNQVLEKNKNNITERCYNSVKKAINNLTMPKSNLSKIESDIDFIAKYIIKTSKEITPLALQKLLYYSQGFFMTFYNKPLFYDDCEAWIHGPVYSKIYDEYRTFGSSNITTENISDIENNIENKKKELIDIVVKSFSYYNGRALEEMTHNESPWKNARKGLFEDVKTNKVIEKAEIKLYFDKVKQKYEMHDFHDIVKYSEALFFRLVGISIDDEV